MSEKVKRAADQYLFWERVRLLKRNAPSEFDKLSERVKMTINLAEAEDK